MGCQVSALDVIEGRARWHVELGDCRTLMATLADKSVDHVITDPPYEAQAHTKQRRVSRGAYHAHGKQKKVSSEDENLSFEPLSFELRTKCGEEFARLCRRWCLAFCQVEGAPIWREAIALEYVRTAVWIKPDGMPQYTGDRPGMGYESIVVCHRKGKKRWNGGGRVGVFTHNKRNVEASNGRGWHETQKPIGLMLELVELFTDPDDIVLDPFAGSGSTGAACLRLGRRFIGCEMDPMYHQTACDRLEAESLGTSLTAARAGQGALFDSMPHAGALVRVGGGQ